MLQPGLQAPLVRLVFRGLQQVAKCVLRRLTQYIGQATCRGRAVALLQSLDSISRFSRPSTQHIIRHPVNRICCYRCDHRYRHGISNSIQQGDTRYGTHHFENHLTGNRFSPVVEHHRRPEKRSADPGVNSGLQEYMASWGKIRPFSKIYKARPPHHSLAGGGYP